MMTDPVVRVYLQGGGRLSLKDCDSVDLVRRLVEDGYAQVMDDKGNIVYLFKGGVSVITGGSL